MGKCKLATLSRRLFEPPAASSSSSASSPPPLPPTAPSLHCLMLWRGREGAAGWSRGCIFYVLLFEVARVYIAEGGPLCGPLQISRSKRGKHGYINKRSRLTAL